MTTHTQLNAIRQPATGIAAGTLAALLLAAFAQTVNASEARTPAGSEPHWTARIGTGQSLVAAAERQTDRADSSDLLRDTSASAHWTARIGTGRADPESRSTSIAASSGVVAPPAHWSAQIGTGHASPATNVQKPAERKVTAEASPPTQVERAIAEPLGEHPAVLVSRSWNSRTIDPNTFIVLHPAGAAPTSGYDALRLSGTIIAKE